ncbi:MAG TPA: response regulator transcription factor [Dehalococcoidia bacterium]|nr:response regulator transcription factor [Dehalococcoidia bacterium]
MAILVVEDELDLSDLLTFILRRAGHDVITAFDGESALRLWREQDPELVLLDVGLPRTNGWEVCRVIRSEATTPVVIVSGLDAEDDMVKGFDLGIEDYVVKPFSPRILQARVRTVLTRAQPANGKSGRKSGTSFGDLTIDSRWRTVACGEKSVRLTRIEHHVLEELARHCGQVVPHEELIQKVWGYKGEASSNVVKGHIRGLRLKLNELGSNTTIRIVPGVGYMLEQAPSS